MNFETGDRVVAVNPVCGLGNLVGKHGTVVHIEHNFFGEANVGVEFDEPFPQGHSADGHGKFGYCWYGGAREFELIDVNEADIEAMFN